ncbi:uncharacterized protein LOC136718518 [Amia ocellicauda]|uniref:uncharacterized protein LOC136718518 n=1 Tax=Amia ocellicauda TaxID=2972642 RepID=UPI003463E015
MGDLVDWLQQRVSWGLKPKAEDLKALLNHWEYSKNPLKHMDLLMHQVFMPVLCGESALTGALDVNADKLLDTSHRFLGQLEMIRGHIKVVLKHDTLALTAKQSPEVGLYQEEALWEKHIQQLHYLNTQLDSDTAREILRTLQQADSTYAPAVTVVCRDIDRALSQAEENMQYFGALLRWFELLKSADTLSEMVKYIPPLVHTMLLSFLQLKGALKLCATFRGCYLDVKAKADEINSKKVEESHQKMPRKPTDSLWSAKLYGPLSARFTPQGWQFPGQQKEAGFEEWVDSPWPSHGAPCFQSMNQFMERCNDVLELVQTIRHFQLLETAAEVGGTGTSGLDAMVREIQESYKRAMASFTSRNAHMLSSQKNQPFEKSFFDFRMTMKELEYQIAGVLRSSFQQCPTIGSQLRLLHVFQGVINRELVQRWSSSPEDLDGHLESIEVNLDPDFMRLLREAVYLRKAPFHIKLSDQVVSLVQKVDVTGLRMLTARLEAVVCKYNQIVGTIGDHERRLLDGRLAAAQELLKTGLSVYTWTTEETADFIELATTLVCSELYSTFATVRNNYKEIAHLSNAWSTGCLDMFSGAGAGRTYSVEEFLQEHEILERSLERQIVSDGQRIRRLIQESFTAVGISEASPAWQDYMEYIDVLLLQDLKQMVFSSLASLLNTVLEEKAPALRVRVELLCGEAGFSPPLEERSVERSLLEHARHCAHACLRRAAQLSPLCQHAQATLEVIRPYEYLWKKDVNETLKGVGRIKCDPGWSDGTGYLMDSMDTLSDRSHSRQSTNLRSQSTRLIEAERSFLAPGHGKQNADAPTLDDYDSQISTYRTDRDNILHLQDLVDVGWIRVDFQPIKQVLAAYAFKWMWTFAKYLMGKMTGTLQNLDAFLKRTEPQLERITGEEKDTGFFMKIMRLFNEVLARQAEMEGQFIVMQKTVKILEKYEFKLPVEEEKLLGSIPGRWNNLKTRVSLAKQRLSPQIQQESGSITKDLESFGDRLHHLKEDIEESDVYTRDCSVETAYHVIKSFGKEVKSLQREAKDLKELQGLLDMIVVDFRTLNECHHTVRNLTLMWQAVEIIRIQQSEWKSQPWQDIDTVQLVSSTDQQRKLIKSLAREVHGWDVYVGTLESINVIQVQPPVSGELCTIIMVEKQLL